MQVYEHHCQHQLPADAARLREAAAYIVENQEAVQWGLEICGFQNVQVGAGPLRLGLGLGVWGVMGI